MLTTSVSLLDRLAKPNQNGAWERFVVLYTPFLSYLLIQHLRVRPQDAADLVQEIFLTLLKTLPKFQYDKAKGNFRGYLRQVCTSKAADLRRKQQPPAANEAELSALEDEQAEADIADLGAGP